MGAGTIIKAMRSLGNTQLIHSVSFLHLAHLISFFSVTQNKGNSSSFSALFSVQKTTTAHFVSTRARVLLALLATLSSNSSYLILIAFSFISFT
jgi:hypothetical protein